MKLQKIVLIGAGNLAHHLAKRMVKQGVPLVQVYNRTREKAEALGKQLHIPFTGKLEELNREADLYILAVADDAIAPVGVLLKEVINPGALVVHCSGATPAGVLKPSFSRHGVFYPLQTFSPGRELRFEEIPVCVSAAVEEDVSMLESLAERLSDQVFRLADKDRIPLHLAAVFVNNFINHMLAAGYSITGRESLPFDLLRPLIRETVAKGLETTDPGKIQTGPALRGDTETIKTHLRYLEQHFPGLTNAYLTISKSINPALEQIL